VFGNLGFGELMVMLVIVLVLFGAKRVPEISASFGKGIREFKKNLSDVESTLLESHSSPPLASYRQPLEQARPMTAHDDTPSEPKRLL